MKTKYIHRLLIIFCLFPFLAILQLPTDSQPNAFLVSLIPILLYGKSKIPLSLLLLGICAVLGVSLIFTDELTFVNARLTYGYLSIFTITWAVYLVLPRLGNYYGKILTISIYVWFAVGMIQTFIDPAFLTFVMDRAFTGGTHGRGVVSLAPEPTFNASMSAIFIFLILLNKKIIERPNLLIFLCLFQMFIWAQSSTVAVVCLAGFGIFVSLRLFRMAIGKVVTYISIGAILFVTIPIIGKTYFKTSRMYYVFSNAIEKPQVVFAIDGSINERFLHAVFPFVGFVEDRFIPHGYGKFKKFMIEKSKEKKYEKYFVYFIEGHYKRIMSAYGAPIFELGIFGLLLPFAVFNAARGSVREDGQKLMFIIFNLVLLTAFPIANAIVPLTIGNMLHIKRINKIEKLTHNNNQSLK